MNKLITIQWDLDSMRKIVHIIGSVLIGLLLVLFFSTYDIIRGQVISLYTIEKTAIFIGFLFISSGTLYLLTVMFKRKIENNIRIKVIWINLIITSLLIASTSGSLIYLFNSIGKEKQYADWKIGIYYMDSNDEFYLYSDNIQNPIITKDIVTDMDAGFVADPFLIRDNKTYYIFFEALDIDDDNGKICYATSEDGKTWTYQKKILDIDSHLSYPQVFNWEGSYYMIPENGEENHIPLYKATEFPEKWSKHATLLSGEPYKDSTIIFWNHTLFMFTSETGARILKLYYSDHIEGPWIEHPSSPLLENEPDYSRPGGRILEIDGKLIRIAQDNYPEYGMHLWGFNITKLSKTEYSEEIIGNDPILEGTEIWNSDGVHHIDMVPFDKNKYLVCIDGKT
jgi:hypothetical protein